MSPLHSRSAVKHSVNSFHSVNSYMYHATMQQVFTGMTLRLHAEQPPLHVEYIPFPSPAPPTHSVHIMPPCCMQQVFTGIVDTWRLDPRNHALPPFDKFITGIVDTCPVPLACLADFHHASLYFQVIL